MSYVHCVDTGIGYWYCGVECPIWLLYFISHDNIRYGDIVKWNRLRSNRGALLKCHENGTNPVRYCFEVVCWVSTHREPVDTIWMQKHEWQQQLLLCASINCTLLGIIVHVYIYMQRGILQMDTIPYIVYLPWHCVHQGIRSNWQSKLTCCGVCIWFCFFFTTD